ncbi:exported hypothetical protein [Candidatus Sulfopaludibacter sp. SbA3]|nr:exported hypothetical protein [Candidatus Sulfopaludibacter sp. SbA3]
MEKIRQKGMERSCQPGTRCLTIALFTAGAVFAQPQDAHPTYEAVNIKLNTSGGDSRQFVPRDPKPGHHDQHDAASPH